MTDFHAHAGPDQVAPSPVIIRKIEVAAVFDALQRGYADFMRKPSHLALLVLIYPIMGIVLALWTSGSRLFPLLYPLISGFALIGPFAALGLYEISRRREEGLEPTWWDAFEVSRSPALPAIALVGALLLFIFFAWLWTAQLLYQVLFGSIQPASIGAFIAELFGTVHGWSLILLGHAIGFVFAAIVLCTTVVAFPLLLDRNVSAYEAIQTSARVVAANPGPMIAWGGIVAVTLLIAILPLFVGLAAALPILGHGTWHLYRKVIERPAG